MCYHEAIATNENMHNPNFKHVGTADSGYVLVPAFKEALGDHRLVIIHRDIDDVEKSLKKIGLMDTRNLLESMVPELEKLDGLHIRIADIDTRIKEIHDYLEIGGYNPWRAAEFSKLNVQSQYWRA